MFFVRRVRSGVQQSVCLCAARVRFIKRQGEDLSSFDLKVRFNVHIPILNGEGPAGTDVPCG